MEGVQDEQLAQMKMLMRALAFGMPVVTHYFPAGVLVYWVTSAGWTLGQVCKTSWEDSSLRVRVRVRVRVRAKVRVGLGLWS